MYKSAGNLDNVVSTIAPQQHETRALPYKLKAGI